MAYPLEFPKVVHLKPMLQRWPWPTESVTDHVSLYLNTQGKLKIGNYQQYNIVHYVDKTFIDDEKINLLEEVLWTK